MSEDPRARRDAIRELLRARRVGTQEELRALIAERGYDVTQATLSRDLAHLGARRATMPGGSTVYELDEAATSTTLATMRDMITGVEASLALVVVFTRAGAASAVALAIDRARLPEILGTIAGDDTIFLAPSGRHAPSAIAKLLKKIWEMEP